MVWNHTAANITACSLAALVGALLDLTATVGARESVRAHAQIRKTVRECSGESRIGMLGRKKSNEEDEGFSFSSRRRMQTSRVVEFDRKRLAAVRERERKRRNARRRGG